MTKQELENILRAKDFKDTNFLLEAQRINVLISKCDEGYRVYSYHIDLPTQTMLVQDIYPTIDEILDSCFFVNLFKLFEMNKEMNKAQEAVLFALGRYFQLKNNSKGGENIKQKDKGEVF